MAVALIIAPEIDMHAFAVRHAAEALGHTIVVIDTADFTRTFDLIARWEGGRHSGQLVLKGGMSIELSQLSGLWWRRPRYPDVSSAVNPAFSEIAKRESREALWGAFNAMVPRAFNAIGSSRAANQKPFQLSLARDVGLEIPETLVSNDEQTVKEFYATLNGEVIYKIFKGPEMGFYPTRKLTSVDLVDLSSLKSCPCIFQKYIRGLYDVRVTVVGDQLFAAKIEYDQTAVSIDSRTTAKKCTRYELPGDLADRILALTRRLGLIYGAIDLRRSVRGDYVFFELNPEGQYLWVEIEAALPISAAIAKFLTSESNDRAAFEPEPKNKGGA